MEIQEFEHELRSKLKKIDIEIDDITIKQFYSYMNLLIEWNEKINLTAIIEPKEIILKHFVDCATILPYIKEKSKILDVGTGAGFPGLPIKLLDKQLEVTLVDSLNKRINFLDEVICKMSIKDIQAIHARAEELARDSLYREKYDILVSRAVAQFNILLEYTLPFVRTGGKVICMKGPNSEEEIKDSKRALMVLGGEIEKIDNIILPDSDIKRNIIVVKKVKNTPKEYPRKAGTPAKAPII